MTKDKTESLKLHLGDCLDVLRTLPDGSVDAVVTDPPYGLSFMGRKWDYDVPSVDVWTECLRVLKPGGHLLAFAGTRTQHRMAVRIEDAGFEIRDMIAWVYGSGFPKSLDVSKAIDKAAGAERHVLGVKADPRYMSPRRNSPNHMDREAGKDGGHGKENAAAQVTAPATDAARQWQGWGTALKPSWECITMARKPLAGTVAENVLRYGTGGINVDGCRVEHGDDVDMDAKQRQQTDNNWGGIARSNMGKEIAMYKPAGRWPANLIHDGSEEVTGLLGEAARFFYCAKASKADRDEGCEGLEPQNNMRVNGPGESEEAKHATKRANHHPTVKPADLMRYLCRLVTPPGGVVLDPFMGSGSTGKAAALEGFRFIGIELDAEYFEIAQRRIDAACRQEFLPLKNDVV